MISSGWVRQMDRIASARNPLTWLLLVALACPLWSAQAASRDLPGPVRDALDTLKASFRGIVGLSGFMEPHMMQMEIEKSRPHIDTVLAYGASSESNADALGDWLCASLATYAERFRPGMQINEEYLKPRRYLMGTRPEDGLNAYAYLLLQVAEQKGSATFTRRALSTLHDVVLAQSYLTEKRTLYKHPDHSQELAREKTEYGGSLSVLGAEIAWCCEQFMVEMSGTPEPAMPEAGMVVIADYCQWREETMKRRMTPNCLDGVRQHRTMAYVRKLADALARE